MNTIHHQTFSDLHHAQNIFLLPNAWDAASAKLFENGGAKAVGTSSASMAWSRGYIDGGTLPFSELINAVSGMARVLTVPLTVDIEDGYSTMPESAAQLAVEIAKAGAVGINIEDGVGAPELLMEKIKSIRKRLNGKPLFINARTDVYLRKFATGDDAVRMTIDRMQKYIDAGADGAFVPGLASIDDMHAISKSLTKPLNVMLVPSLPDVSELSAVGVKRVSLGPAPFLIAYGAAQDGVRQFLSGSYDPLLNGKLTSTNMNTLFKL